jgi:predicted O-methyltransferase YrrM
MNLAEMYLERCATPSDIHLHLPRFVAMVHEAEAQHVIELGSRSGVSTVAWLYALEKTGGRLTSVDLDCAPEIGTWSHWRHIRGDDLDRLVMCQLPPADIVFIDTSHALQQTRDELEAYLPLVRRPGLIVLHDTELPQPMDAPLRDGVFPVKRAVREFVKRHGFEWDNYPECNGLGIVKVV